jgi:hypothetical protein
MADFTYLPHQRVISRVRAERITLWSVIEDDFLAAMTSFDTDFVAGRNVMKEDYKTKGTFFNDVIAALVANRTGKHVGSRGKRAGTALKRHDVDLVYPSPTGISATEAINLHPVICAETKIAGTPPHDANKGSGADGRPANQDLDKRVREMIATCIDLKLRWGGGPLTIDDDGISTAAPTYLVFYACRVANSRDQAIIVDRLTQIERHYVDGVGVFLFAGSNDAQTTYAKVIGVPGHTIDEMLDLFVERMTERVAA